MEVTAEPGLANEDVRKPDESTDYTGDNKTVQATVHVGQEFFRRSVLSAYKYQCCITGLSMPQL
ncbi:MAG: hypothetical protein ACYCR3_11015 [Acidithiobacillus sp.]